MRKEQKNKSSFRKWLDSIFGDILKLDIYHPKNMPNEKITIIKKIGNFVSNILLGDTKETIIRTDEGVSRIDEDIKEIKIDCKKIWEKISRQGEDITGLKVHTAYGVSDSPIVPSEKGKKLLEKSGFNKSYPELKEEIFGLMDSNNLRTLYDYEKGAEEVLNQLKNNPLMDEIKEYAVNHPDEPLKLIFRVASWVIRDDYKSHKQKQGL